jgi:hypothetical protein
MADIGAWLTRQYVDEGFAPVPGTILYDKVPTLVTVGGILIILVG